MTATTNSENLRQYKIRFSLIVGHVLAFASSPEMVREVKNLSPSFNQIVGRSFTLLNILILIVMSILLISSKQFHQALYSDNLYIVDIICHFS